MSRNNYPSMQPFESRCRWWIPDSPKQAAPGVVGFDGKRITVTLDEWTFSTNPLEFPEFTCLHGETLDGSSVTVFGAFTSHCGPEYRLTANKMCTGGHLLPISEQLFDQVVVGVNGLAEWRSRRPIQVEQIPSGELNVTCDAPNGQDIRISGHKTSITFAETQNQIGGGQRFEVQYETHIRVRPDSPKPVDWFSEINDVLRELLTLLFDQDAVLTELSVSPKGFDDWHSRVGWFWNRRSSEITEIDRFRLLIPMPDLNDQLESIINNWFSKSEENKHSRALLFSHLATPGAFLETRFLPVVQSLEVYSRLTKASRYIAKSEFKELKRKLFEQLPNGLDEGLAQKLKTSIGHSNEFGLIDRIDGLINSLSQPIRSFICDDSKKFASRLTATRNYYTHYGDSSGRHLVGNELYWATEQATLLMKMLFLKDAGVSEPLLVKQLNASSKYSQGRDIWREIEVTL